MCQLDTLRNCKLMGGLPPYFSTYLEKYYFKNDSKLGVNYMILYCICKLCMNIWLLVEYI